MKNKEYLNLDNKILNFKTNEFDINNFVVIKATEEDKEILKNNWITVKVDFQGKTMIGKITT